MPKITAGRQKYYYKDNDTATQILAPPIKDQWYTVLNKANVRALFCLVIQTNTEVGAKSVEMRWTIDGNAYFTAQNLNSATGYWFYRSENASSGGTAGLGISLGRTLANYTTAKHGHQFKVEIRITSALGTAQYLECDCTYETLELT